MDTVTLHRRARAKHYASIGVLAGLGFYAWAFAIALLLAPSYGQRMFPQRASEMLGLCVVGAMYVVVGGGVGLLLGLATASVNARIRTRKICGAGLIVLSIALFALVLYKTSPDANVVVVIGLACLCGILAGILTMQEAEKVVSDRT